MKAVQLGDYVCIYADHSLPEVYRDRAIHVERVPERPEGRYRMGIEDGQLVWVENPEEDPTEPSVWDELDAAYREGVDSI